MHLVSPVAFGKFELVLFECRRSEWTNLSKKWGHMLVLIIVLLLVVLSLTPFF